MKAKELLRLYDTGQRDFSSENLRGKNFQGKDLSGADLSNTDIRGANFTKTKLIGANFKSAKAGLQRRWATVLVITSWLLSGISGVFSGLSGSLAVLIFNTDNLESVILGWSALGVLVIFFTITIRRGINAVAGAVAGALAGALAGVGTLAVAVAITFAVAGTPAVALAVTITLLSAYIGWRALARDEKYTWIRTSAIAIASIGGTSFRCANLTNADFAKATLKSTDLRDATITRTNWHQTKKLDRARVGGTLLQMPNVLDLLVTHRGSKRAYAGLILKGANLIGADLSDVNLTEADVSEATLEGAWMERANLTKTRALNTNFHQAKITGACLEAWNINSTTQLEGAICDYVYLLGNQQERRPSSGNFKPGEFTKLFEEVANTLDLIFREGLNWKAFAHSFKKIEVEHDDAQLEIRSIENKGEGVVVVRVNVAPDVDKAKIHSDFMQGYEFVQKILEAQHQARLKDKDKEINRLFHTVNQLSNKLGEVPKLMSEVPKYDLRNAQFAGGFAETVQGDQIGGTQHNYAAPESQTLAEAAAEIQKLLKQLEETNPTATEAEKQAFVNLAIPPTRRERFLNAVQAGSLAALEEFPGGGVVKAILEGWMEVD